MVAGPVHPVHPTYKYFRTLLDKALYKLHVLFISCSKKDKYRETYFSIRFSYSDNRAMKLLIAETAHALVSMFPLQQSHYPSRFPIYLTSKENMRLATISPGLFIPHIEQQTQQKGWDHYTEHRVLHCCSAGASRQQSEAGSPLRAEAPQQVTEH